MQARGTCGYLHWPLAPPAGRRIALACLLWLTLWAGPPAAGPVAAQSPQLEIEAADGDYLIWRFDPAGRGWQPLAFPPGFDATRLAGAAVVEGAGLHTVVSAGGRALLTYDLSVAPDRRRLLPVANNLTRLADGRWLRWGGGTWRETEAPAGADDPLSWAMQSFINANARLPYLGLYGLVAMVHPDDGEPFLFSEAGSTFAFASSRLMTAAGERAVPLLVTLIGENAVGSIFLLARNLEEPANFDAYTRSGGEAVITSLGPMIHTLRTGSFESHLSGEWTRVQAGRGGYFVALEALFGQPDILDAAALEAHFAPGGAPAATLAPAGIAAIQPEDQACRELAIPWQERRRGDFILLAAEEDMAAVQRSLAAALSGLPADYDRLQRYFAASLDLPISIRVYPSELAYYCFNALAPALTSGGWHGRIGAREIALIWGKLNPGRPGRETQIHNALRYELATLFVAKMSGGNAPPGLAAGAGVYAEDPAELMATTSASPSVLSEPRLDWRALWEEPAAGQNRALALRAHTTVAYLVDKFGWPAFRQFLQALPAGQGYRQALLDTYSLDVSQLEREWQSYHAFYYGGRWQYNLLYNFDLDKYRQLIEASAYAGASAGLQEAMAFLGSVGETEKVAQAEALLQHSQRGQAAAVLADQARQALRARDYEQAILLAGQAEAEYVGLGDLRRIEELQGYSAWAQEVLALRQEIAALEGAVAAGDAAALEASLAAGQELAALGDPDEVARLQATLQQDQARREQQALDAVLRGLGAVAILLLASFVLLLFRRPEESRLI
ncbi:MAG: peptidase MA family metallohydrolase [Candidatus Promineifilaceae bacterium]